VHHANILLDQTPRSRELDERDLMPGYDGALARTAMNPEGHFLGYTPGRPDPLLPKGLAWRLDPGTDLVLQLHLKPTGKAEIIRPSVGFYFTDDAAARVPFIMRLGRQTLDIAAGQKNYPITDSDVVPVDVQVQALKPHAHYLARELNAVATLPDGTTKHLLYIRDWDFKWQNVYRFAAPEAAAEEIVGYWGLLDQEPDNPVLNDDIALLYLELGQPDAAVAHFERSLQVRPDSAAGHFNLGTALMFAGRLEEAVNQLREAVRLKPDYAAAHNNLGNALADQNRLDEALSHYVAALRIQPNYARAHNGVAILLMQQGQFEEALTHLHNAIEIEPALAEAHHNMALTQQARGRYVEAARYFRDAVRLRPDSPEILADCAWILATAPEELVRDSAASIELGEMAAVLTRRLDARVLDVVAAAYAEAGWFDRALATVGEAIRLNPPEALRQRLTNRTSGTLQTGSAGAQWAESSIKADKQSQTIESLRRAGADSARRIFFCTA
jgi:tetratricopeptide (TPR) repeat protein